MHYFLYPRPLIDPPVPPALLWDTTGSKYQSAGDGGFRLNGTLAVSTSASSTMRAQSTTALSGKTYFEYDVFRDRDETAGQFDFGVHASVQASWPATISNHNFISIQGIDGRYSISVNGVDGGSLGGVGSGGLVWTRYSFATIGVAVDVSLRKVWFKVNGTWTEASDPASNVGGYAIGGTQPIYLLADLNCTAATERSVRIKALSELAFSPPAGFTSIGTAPITPPLIWSTLRAGSGIFLADAFQTAGSDTNQHVVIADFRITGKKYWEASVQNTVGYSAPYMGLVGTNKPVPPAQYEGSVAGISSLSGSIEVRDNFVRFNGGAPLGYPDSPVSDSFRFAFDADTHKFWIGSNALGIWFGGGDPAAGTSPTFTLSPDRYAFFCQPLVGASNSLVTCIFTAAEMIHSAPSGFTTYA